MKKAILLVLVTSFISINGCAPLPGIKPYHPVSDWEARELKNASRNIYPNDVRKEISKYSNSLIVWPGIILDSEMITHDDKVEVKFLVEHHFYNWLEDHGFQREKIFLSPHGEGNFRTSWYLKKGIDPTPLKKMASAGNLVIVYGYPRKIESDSTIIIESKYIRGIEKQWFRTDVLDYGRPGEKVNR
jgi:hypothetical protein